MRDNFSPKTKRVLAQRAGYLCSFPGCRVPTVGPKSEVDSIMLTGDAAHIKGASPAGPRYDPRQATAARRHISNGIWLCVLHARIIDADNTRYSSSKLTKWKEQHERLVSQLQLGLVRLSDGVPLDKVPELALDPPDADLFLQSVPFVASKRDTKGHLRDLVRELGVKSDAQAQAKLRIADQDGFLVHSRSTKRREDLLWDLRCARRQWPIVTVYLSNDRIHVAIDISATGYAIPWYAAYAINDYVALLLGGDYEGGSGDSFGSKDMEFVLSDVRPEVVRERLVPILSWLKGAGLFRSRTRS